MIVMPANATGIRVGYVARRYEAAPSRLGHLFSPGAQTGPHAFMPYALDNGAYGCWTAKSPFDVPAWQKLLDWSANSGQRPLWALVPDSVGNRAETLRMWAEYEPVARSYAWPLAFAAQDGMTFDDVPSGADVVFLGGSTGWKWDSLFAWCARFPRVHVGRVNGLRQLRLCARAGANSCDGTGFGRTTRQWLELERFLAEQAGEASIQENESWLSANTGDGTAA